ncbi:MAG: NAD(P)/FAD-dependent oxidoreductase [Acetivibrio ethanolgignens]
MEGIERLQQSLQKKYNGKVTAEYKDQSIVVSGHLGKWEDIVAACQMCVQPDKKLHVVNDIVLDGVDIPKMRIPSLKDDALEGDRPDVLIIGGGISGASIARELSKWKLNILLVEKESDLAMQASGRNDGEVHPGVDLNVGTLKQHYVLLGNAMYEKICEELSVPFSRDGQYVGFSEKGTYPLVKAYAWQRRNICKVKGTRVVKKDVLQKNEPRINKGFSFALYSPSAGCVCPYGLTIAYGENAVSNGARISLNTAVLSMEVSEGTIKSVLTNRGRIYPKLVINAAGVFADNVAEMAKDRFFSIHPRRGTDVILDKKTGKLVKGVVSFKTLKKDNSHTKGGGILHTVHGNLLVGPDAVETYEKENMATTQESIETLFAKHGKTVEDIKRSDVITYFTGVRAATFEEDYIIEFGRKTRNILHCAGIQSPGLTTAPAVALDIEKMAVEFLQKTQKVEKNKSYNPRRKGIPVLREMEPEERDRLIKENPDYGVIVCRCEEISKGEILDALHAPLVVPTVDGIKKRVRPGMGRCQGGFCMPLVAQIIHEETGMPLEAVRKADVESVLTYGPTKEVAE